jgi:hypothetical protein
VLTGETKYFLSNRVVGQTGWTLRDLLRVDFTRWRVEACFREVKEQLGWDHFECRGWRCIHRHLYVTILSGLFCARVRQQLSPASLVVSGELLTMEQVRRAAMCSSTPSTCRANSGDRGTSKNSSSNATTNAATPPLPQAHRKTRWHQLHQLGINPNQIKSVPPKQHPG